MVRYPEVTGARERMRWREARRLYVVRCTWGLDAHERRVVMYWVRRWGTEFAGADLHAVGYGVRFSVRRWVALQWQELARWWWARRHREEFAVERLPAGIERRAGERG